MGEYFKNRMREPVHLHLLKSSGGVFEITVNDKLVFSKKALGRFPSDPEIEAMLAD